MMSAEQYIQQLFQEKDVLEPQEFGHTIRLLQDEITRVRSDEDLPAKKTKFKEDIIKLTEKVIVPVDEYPKFNFVGKLLGPKGNTLKRMQANTKTKISILGRGSTREKEEEELSKSDDPKYYHLREPLHVLIEVEALKSEAHQRIGTALSEVYKYLVPENDQLRNEQMREMAILNGDISQKVLGGGGGSGGPIFSFGLPPPGAFILNELPSAYSYTGSPHSAKNPISRKRSAPLDGHSKSNGVYYGDY